MTTKTIELTDTLYHYLLDHSLREAPALAALREETHNNPICNNYIAMQIAPEQGQFMGLLAQLIGAKRTLEIGVFTGYSTLSVALALPVDGQIVACDISDEWTAIGQRYWQQAGVADKIDLRLAPAQDTLAALLTDNQAETFDFAFIDADKESYSAYYEQCLQLLRPGGLIVVDNVLWSGAVIDTDKQDADTQAIRSFNSRIHQDERVDISMLAVADGLTLIRKR